MKKFIILLLTITITILLLNVGYAQPQLQQAPFYTAIDVSTNEKLYSAVMIYQGDQYISKDNKRYVVESTDDTARTALARHMEDVALPEIFEPQKENEYNPLAILAATEYRAVGIYTMYNGGNYSMIAAEPYGSGGIVKVAECFRDFLSRRGVDAILSRALNQPKDQALERSRKTITRLIKRSSPVALININIDQLPKEEYIEPISGKNACSVRIVIGLNEQYFEQRLEFALRIKAIADKAYPRLIKDIVITNEQTNQDLSEYMLTLTVGTSMQDIEFAYNTMPMLSDSVSAALFGGTIRFADVDPGSDIGEYALPAKLREEMQEKERTEKAQEKIQQSTDVMDPNAGKVGQDEDKPESPSKKDAQDLLVQQQYIQPLIENAQKPQYAGWSLGAAGVCLVAYFIAAAGNKSRKKRMKIKHKI